MIPPDAATSQRRIGRYLLQEELGRGGMGVVYAALDEELGRRVALKLLRPGGPGDDAALAERFAQEMQIAISLEHPNIVPVHETGTEDGVRYIAMRLVDGEDLGAVLRREGALEPARVARLGRQIAAALDAAHAKGLVHRDVKPGNVLLSGSGDEEHAYLTDFGLTRDADSGMTETGQWIGTVDYAAPEQIDAAPLSARTDVYALGCVFYHLLTGALPFTGSFAVKATAHVTRPLPSVGLPAARGGDQIDKVLAVATAKAPGQRHASAGALARALARIVATGEQDAGQRTAAMPVVIADDEEPGVTAAREADATAVLPREPRSPSTPVTPRPRPRTRPVPADRASAPGPVDPLSRDRAARPRALPLVAAGVALLAVIAVIALMTGGGDDPGPGSDANALTSSNKGDAKQATTAQPPAKKPTPPPPVVIPTTKYTAPAGGYSAKVPAGEGWSNRGERNLNGIIRTTFAGPDGQQLWIDSTPTMAPAFGREGRTVTQQRTLDGPLGPIAGYRFTGVPTEFCGGGCVDYQLDLGGRGFAVLAGPTSSARRAARTTILSLQPTEGATAQSPPAAGTPPNGEGDRTPPGKVKKQGGKKDGG